MITSQKNATSLEKGKTKQDRKLQTCKQPPIEEHIISATGIKKHLYFNLNTKNMQFAHYSYWTERFLTDKATLNAHIMLVYHIIWEKVSYGIDKMNGF